jgi:hypothetical protein
MSDRIDELKGNVKKGLGDLTGNKRLARTPFPQPASPPLSSTGWR